ncbi:MAG: ABC transporter substrate-binding protein [Actinobacteria bacterium]|nr:ABC transporter substrate-binding protein [Actinomycetota bacterium]
MSEKSNDDSIFENPIDRRELLKRGGALGAAAAAAGALGGQAGAAINKVARHSAKPKKGGHVTWALEQDPGHIAPFGGTLTMTRTAQEPMYESLLQWDKNLNIQPALATGYTVIDKKTIDFHLRKGVKFHNGKELTADDCVYSFAQQLNPPLPGSIATVGQVPAIDSTEARGKYTLRMHLKAPDARIYGFLAWQRYSAIVPRDMYQNLNAATQGIGTGPYKLDGSYVPNDHLSYVRNTAYWNPALPYLDAINYRIITDEQARIAALRAGAIDGATLTVDSANSLKGQSNLHVLKGLTAAFRELQMTIKAGENKPWADRRVRQAVNMAINRQDIINKVYNGEGQYSGHVAAGYGPWVIPQAELKAKWEKYDLPTAKKLMAAAGFSKGFDVSLSTFSTPLDFPAIATLIKSHLSKIGINVNIVPQDPASFGANNGKGAFEWDLTARGMRGDVDGYVAEFNPTGALGKTVYNTWFNGYTNKRMWKLVGNGRITLDTKKRLPMYQELDRLLMTELIEVPLISVNKYQVVNAKLHDMYVAFTDFNTGLVRNAWMG